MTAGPRHVRSLAERLFCAALCVLPPDMRERDGAEIEALFADDAEAARASGVPRHLAFVIGAVWDILRRAPYEH